jgi:hypothetical protein
MMRAPGGGRTGSARYAPSTERLPAPVRLLAVTAAIAAHWIVYPDRARAHLDNPVMAHFYGAPPMALLAFRGWLMPVVPPMVSLATGALLVPHAPGGQLREALLLGCYAMFGFSLLASNVVITLLWNRLAHDKSRPGRDGPHALDRPGPLGQRSITAGLRDHVGGAGRGADRPRIHPLRSPVAAAWAWCPLSRMAALPHGCLGTPGWL